jgi:hypothetical protein
MSAARDPRSETGRKLIVEGAASPYLWMRVIPRAGCDQSACHRQAAALYVDLVLVDRRVIVVIFDPIVLPGCPNEVLILQLLRHGIGIPLLPLALSS